MDHCRALPRGGVRAVVPAGCWHIAVLGRPAPPCLGAIDVARRQRSCRRLVARGSLQSGLDSRHQGREGLRTRDGRLPRSLHVERDAMACGRALRPGCGWNGYASARTALKSRHRPKKVLHTLSTGSRAACHSGQPSSRRRALNPFLRISATASNDMTHQGPRQ